MSKIDLKSAHSHSSYHRNALRKSKLCGCFYCERRFSYSTIDEWIDGNETALCPYCGIDSVIGDASGYAITPEFLKTMSDHWFN